MVNPEPSSAPKTEPVGAGRHIGRPMPHPSSRRHVAGGGRYLDDLSMPGLLHAAFLRSPHAHARIRGLDTSAARQCDGVVAVVTAADLAGHVKGWQGISVAFPGLTSPVQTALATDRACWQGAPVALVIAETRAQAEDAAALIRAEFEPLPACTRLEEANDDTAPHVHPEIGSNVALDHHVDQGAVDSAFDQADHIVTETLHFPRHTGVPMETRGLIAQYERGDGALIVWHSTQVPNQSKVHLADLLGLAGHKVRVIAPDIGGGFGMKMHTYPDEVAVCAAAMRLGRPVKFVCDRYEGLSSDVHAREHVVTARMALDADGRIRAFDVDDLFGLGAYSMAPRTGVTEPLSMLRLIGAPYRFDAYRGRTRACFLNTAPAAQYRAVGHPIAVTITERLMDKAAAVTGLAPLGIRSRNYLEPGAVRTTTPAGATVFDMSHSACQAKLAEIAPLSRLAEERTAHRDRGVYRGIGLASFVEMTATGPAQYGGMGVAISAMDTAVATLEASGGLTCTTSVTEIGQGTTAALAQIAADAVGVAAGSVVIRSGDTASSGPGGGVWASRGVAIGGEAMWLAGRKLRANILETAGLLMQVPAGELDIRDGRVVADGGASPAMALSDLAQMAFYRGNELAGDAVPQLSVSAQYHRKGDLGLPTNGIQAAHVEVDPDLGTVRLLHHWVVDDCGTVVNPLLLDEQVRGGVVQGLGAALFEHSAYGADGALLAGSLTSYRVPMAGGMPDITIGHVTTPYDGSELGAKGGGEAGTCAAAAAVLNAVNDAIAPFGATVTRMPMTPGVILAALAEATAR